MKYLRFEDLRARGIFNNRETLRRWIRDHGFPPPIRLGPNTVAWPAKAVQAWLDARETVEAA
jgi:predicted DNA-binding transcriptional regulator AlpA